jgi:hypothetical protein
MKRLGLLLIVLCLVSVLPVMAQDPNQPAQPAPVVQPAKDGVWDILSDPNNIAPAAFLLSNVADAKTDWHFTGPLTHKEYTITPAERLGIAGGSIFVAYTLRHYYPKLAKPINLVMAVATAYFAGRAYANTFNHGQPASDVTNPAQGKGTALAFSVRIR